jgi:diguanylate cyclase (GGDEF)-like protein
VPQLAVLLAASLQALWLSVTTSLRLLAMQAELDKAHAAGSALSELARRDPLTGLLNRRGFIDQLQRTFRGRETALALLLIDVDLFKSINDQFGHETGDAVLCRIAEHLRGLEQDHIVCARMGGEEFVLAVSGFGSLELARFAERVRQDLAACDHGEVSRHRVVTASIGVAEGSNRTPFQKLYAAADRALYDAKRAGRNKVRFAAGPGDLALLEELERDQFSFAWPGGARSSGGGPRTG